jgi:hypothetical protein
MGLKLAMSGVAGVTRQAVEAALGEYARSNNGNFCPASCETETPGILLICDGESDRLTVVYPWNFLKWDDASAYLSRTLHAPVFSLHIHDEDLWMYVLFVDGVETDWFNPVPDYWSGASDEEQRAKWSGNPKVVTEFWPGIIPEQIARYLREWAQDDVEPGKAYADDKYDVNCWQLADFMNRLGLSFPIDDDGNWLGAPYHFVVDANSMM